MMSDSIPANYLDLLENPHPAIMSTLSPQGAPENTVVWCLWDGEYVLVNTAEGRRKPANVRRDPRVAITIYDTANPYRHMDIRGIVVEIEPDPDYANINAMAQKYEGVDEYYGGYAPLERKGSEERIIFKIKPRRVVIYPRGH